MKIRNYDDLREGDLWVTDGDGKEKIMQGQEGIFIEYYEYADIADYFVPAETLPDDFFC